MSEDEEGDEEQFIVVESVPSPLDAPETERVGYRNIHGCHYEGKILKQCLIYFFFP